MKNDGIIFYILGIGMFKKRNINKNLVRALNSEDLEEINLDSIQNRKSKPLVTDIEVARSHHLKFRSEEINYDAYNNETKSRIAIFSHETDRIFNDETLVNNYDLSLKLEQKSNSDSKKKNIFKKCKYDTLESKNPNIKSTLRMDYQHDICKDYKETGYCGFGDTCKFLHDRSEFKSSWKIDKEWKNEQKKRLKLNQYSNENLMNVEENVSESKNLPSICFICQEEWNKNSNPVVTICSHFFCEKCALNHYIKSSRCFQCGLPTNGIFNTAFKVTDPVSKDLEDNELNPLSSININDN